MKSVHAPFRANFWKPAGLSSPANQSHPRTPVAKVRSPDWSLLKAAPVAGQWCEAQVAIEHPGIIYQYLGTQLKEGI